MKEKNVMDYDLEITHVAAKTMSFLHNRSLRVCKYGVTIQYQQEDT